ncbi:MAG: hypothetical protein ACFFCQ_06600 [Promethearchaeota archaeon]
MRKTKQYELEFNVKKRRYYSKLKGFWIDPSIVDSYFEDLKNLNSVVRHFTFSQDLTDLRLVLPEVFNKLGDVSEWLYRNGLLKSAEILSPIKDKLSVRRIGKRSGIEIVKKQFYSFTEAEIWLDIAD